VDIEKLAVVGDALTLQIKALVYRLQLRQEAGQLFRIACGARQHGCCQHGR
jgi:hypothetical protein